MVSIEEAIKKSKELPNISNGGSECYDFGDVVLIKYSEPLKYMKPGKKTRENQEVVMKEINKKADKGVNTPKHIAMKRVVEGDYDVCYVLQEKCKGRNWAPMTRTSKKIDEIIKDLKYVNDIPFKHFEKLVADACMLYEMGYERQNKNLFYDEETGFWFIDFLYTKENDMFDPNDPRKLFRTTKKICPQPLQLVSRLKYGETIPAEYQEEYDMLRYSLEAKYYLAFLKVIPSFKKYVFFYLLDKDDSFKKYLVENDIVTRDLFNPTTADREVYDELVNFVVKSICQDVSMNGIKYWQVQTNEIINKSRLFSLDIFYHDYISQEVNTDINKADFPSIREYNIEISTIFVNTIMDLIYKELCTMEKNDNITNFISDYDAKHNKGNML